MCARVYACAPYVCSAMRPEEGIGYPGRVSGGCKHLMNWEPNPHQGPLQEQQVWTAGPSPQPREFSLQNPLLFFTSVFSTDEPKLPTFYHKMLAMFNNFYV